MMKDKLTICWLKGLLNKDCKAGCEVFVIFSKVKQDDGTGLELPADCDGQLLIVSDLIGQFTAFTPKFVKQYANVAEIIANALRQYARDVRAGAFPTGAHCYHMIEGEDEKLRDVIKEYE